MIAVDTNILVRYAIKDDRKQAAAATSFLKKNSCFIPKTVLLELAWVLSSSSGYNLPKETTCERLRHICGLPTIRVEDAQSVAQAINWHEQGLDLADALHLASSENLSGFATMDRKLIKKADQTGIGQKIILVS
jgi:predicted nucleic-acid-binding protein